MTNVNEMSDQEITRLLNKIRRKAKQEGEAIKAVKDAYGYYNAYMVIDAFSGNIVDSVSYSLDIAELAERYSIAY